MKLPEVYKSILNERSLYQSGSWPPWGWPGDIWPGQYPPGGAPWNKPPIPGWPGGIIEQKPGLHDIHYPDYNLNNPRPNNPNPYPPQPSGPRPTNTPPNAPPPPPGWNWIQWLQWLAIFAPWIFTQSTNEQEFDWEIAPPGVNLWPQQGPVANQPINLEFM